MPTDRYFFGILIITYLSKLVFLLIYITAVFKYELEKECCHFNAMIMILIGFCHNQLKINSGIPRMQVFYIVFV